MNILLKFYLFTYKFQVITQNNNATPVPPSSETVPPTVKTPVHLPQSSNNNSSSPATDVVIVPPASTKGSPSKRDIDSFVPGMFRRHTSLAWLSVLLLYLKVKRGLVSRIQRKKGAGRYIWCFKRFQVFFLSPLVRIWDCGTLSKLLGNIQGYL